MEVNSVFYESTAIGHHFRSKKSLALAYLMTIGSKALVLMEVNAEIEPSHQQVSVQKSFDDEAEIKRQMVHEEQLSQFQRALNDRPGVHVLKRGRNGEFRQINIRVKDDIKRGTKMVVWHSRLGGKKSFTLDPTMSVHVIQGDETSAVASKSGGSGCFLCNVPILQLGNHSRQLEIQFMSVLETNVCLHLLHTLGIINSKLNDTTYNIDSYGNL